MRIRISNDFMCIYHKKSKPTIGMPPLPELKDDNDYNFMMWRRYRFGVFHECAHIIYTPLDFSKVLRDRDINKEIYNVIEDLRIEKKGLTDYPGYIKEREFITKYAEEQMKEINFEEHIQNPRGILCASYLWASLWKMRMPDWAKKTLPEDDRNIIEGSIKEIISIETAQDAFDISERVCRGLDLHYEISDPPPQIPFIQTEAEQEHSMTIKVDAPVSESIRSEFNEIIGSKKRALKEAELPALAALVKDIKIPSLEIHFPEENIERYYQIIQDKEYEISLLQSNLRKWKIGWEEFNNIYGSDLDIDEYILGGDKIFLDEKKLSCKTNLMILLDVSGSTDPYHREYLAMTGIIAETLNYLNIKFILNAFGHDNYLFPIAAHHWNNLSRARLGGVSPHGETPLGASLAYAYRQCKENGVDRIILISDGIPSDRERAWEISRRIRTSGIGIYGIAYIDNRAPELYTERIKKECLESYRKILTERGMSRLRIIEKLSDMPREFFRLVSL